MVGNVNQKEFQQVCCANGLGGGGGKCGYALVAIGYGV